MKRCTKSFEDMFEEWNAEFPFLKRYSPTTMYERVGPLMVGLRLERYEDKTDPKGYLNNYRLYYEIIPLWTSDPKRWGTCVSDELLIEKRVRFRKVSRQAFVQYWYHDLLFQETLEAAKSQYDKVIGPEIKLSDMIDFIEAAYKRMSLKNVSTRTFVLKLELGLGVYLNSETLINEVWRKIEKEKKKWDIRHFEYLHRCSVDDWIEKMHEFAQYRDAIIENVEQNCKRPRIARLNAGEFTGADDYQPPKPTWLDRLYRLLPI